MTPLDDPNYGPYLLMFGLAAAFLVAWIFLWYSSAQHRAEIRAEFRRYKAFHDRLRAEAAVQPVSYAATADGQGQLFDPDDSFSPDQLSPHARKTITEAQRAIDHHRRVSRVMRSLDDQEPAPYDLTLKEAQERNDRLTEHLSRAEPEAPRWPTGPQATAISVRELREGDVFVGGGHVTYSWLHQEDAVHFGLASEDGVVDVVTYAQSGADPREGLTRSDERWNTLLADEVVLVYRQNDSSSETPEADGDDTPYRAW